MRVAFHSPRFPQASVSSIFTAELLRLLADTYEIDVFTGVTELCAKEGYRLLPAEQFSSYANTRDYAINLYHMWNDAHCEEVYHNVLQYSGVVVMHDLTLFDFHAQAFGARTAALLKEVRYCHPEYGEHEILDSLRGKVAADRLNLNMLRRVAENSLGLVADSRWGTEQLHKVTPRVPCYFVPLGAPVCSTEVNISSRRQLSLSDDNFVVVTLGGVSPFGCIIQLVRAFSELYSRDANARLLVVGPCSNVAYRGAVERTIRDLRLQEGVVLASHVPSSELDLYLQACDLVVNLDGQGAGGNSELVTRTFAFGKPIVVHDLPQFRDYDDLYCWRVPTEETAEGRRLVDILLRSARNRSDVRLRGKAAQTHVQRQADMSSIAQQYDTIIRDTVASKQNKVARKTEVVDPLIEVSGVNCIGDVTAASGLSVAARNTVEMLVEAKVPCSFVEHRFDFGRHDEVSPSIAMLSHEPIFPINILFYNIHEMESYVGSSEQKLTASKYTIGFWAWELKRAAFRIQTVHKQCR